MTQHLREVFLFFDGLFNPFICHEKNAFNVGKKNWRHICCYTCQWIFRKRKFLHFYWVFVICMRIEIDWRILKWRDEISVVWSHNNNNIFHPFFCWRTENASLSLIWITKRERRNKTKIQCERKSWHETHDIHFELCAMSCHINDNPTSFGRVFVRLKSK